jgi:hypothetical protein
MTNPSRATLIGLGALFSAYHVFLGVVSLYIPRHPGPAIGSLVLYAVATTASLWAVRRARMPIWLAAFDLAVSIAIPLLVSSQLDAKAENGYATWYIAAMGALMTIVAVRRQALFAWLGAGFLAVHTVFWAGLGSVVSLGVLGSVVWVAGAVVVMRTFTRAIRDTDHFARAERQAAEWQAAQEAHVSERQHRLAYTYRMAEPLLTEIVRSRGDLTPEQRAECLLLEGAMRDEIRGRALLNDGVRAAVAAARRRGATVSLLDEGGLDGMDAPSRQVVLDRLAQAVRGSAADKLIVRTVPRASEVAVTVVGLRAPERTENADADTDADTDDEVELWLEIPRTPR